MAGASDFAESMLAVSHALAEAVETIAAAGGKPDAVAYANSAAATALERLEILVRRYGVTDEGRGVHTGKPTIIADTAFRAAAERTAVQLESSKDLIGAAAERIAASIRVWVKSGDAQHASRIGVQAAAALRLAKKRVDRVKA